MITKYDIPVANEEICACARSGCKWCYGRGFIETNNLLTGEPTHFTVCRCAKRRFMRLNKELIETHEGKFWWRMDPLVGDAEAPATSVAQ